MTAFDDELAIEAAEARLVAPLDAHAAATIAALRAGRRPPPWPTAAQAPALARLAARHDRAWAARARTLVRWHHAARLASDVEVAAAARGPRTIAGLAARLRALGGAAARLGFADVDGLIATLYGAPLAAIDGGADDDHDDDGAAPPLPGAPLPTWTDVRDHLAQLAGVDGGGLVVCDDAAAAATVVATGGATCLFPRVTDLASLTVATHELGHGLYATAMRGLPLGLAAAPSRAVDEAVAAWAVRALEPRLPPAWAAVAAWRRRRGARTRRRLAAMVRQALATGDATAAWAATMGARAPAAYPAIVDEPGAAEAYAVADRLALAPGPGELARWGACGAALDLADVGVDAGLLA